jgi:hypothetical protein
LSRVQYYHKYGESMCCSSLSSPTIIGCRPSWGRGNSNFRRKASTPFR